MIKRVLVGSMALAAMVAGPSMAADMPLKAPPPAPVATWTGWYIGINGGGVWGHATPQLTIGPGGLAPGDPLAISQLTSAPFNNSGGLVGGQVGFLLQAGSVVSGFEAAFDWMNAKGSAARSAPAPGLPGSTLFVNQSVSTSWLATFTGRVGVDMGAWYPYGTVGVAVAGLKYNYAYADNFVVQGLESISLSGARAGVVAGAGLEWRWDSHWSLRAEGLFMRFNDIAGNGVASCLPAGCHDPFSHQVSFTESVARGMLSYKF